MIVEIRLVQEEVAPKLEGSLPVETANHRRDQRILAPGDRSLEV